ncbi:phage integrase [Actinokineospora fastidiosa]|uniref:Phage integrase n=1 Tax=Actinokineospora fastidiosa TaxID=1816 RepID=A0A918G7C6_9PSEU|nr:phage integrase [Actinokineospora fastidiosa]
MGRPSLPVGTHGAIRCYRLGPKRYRAVTDYRDYDGRTRRVERTAASRTGAEQRLKEALRDRGRTSGGSEITAESKVAVVAEQWMANILEAVEDGRRSPGTADVYRARLDKQVLPAIGALRLREVTVSRLDRLVSEVQKRHGKSTAKTTRTVLSGVLKLAVRHDALSVNLVAGVGRIEGQEQGVAQALTLEQAVELRAKIAAHPKARIWDLPDFTDMMLATGLRIGEASAVTWDALDLVKGTVEVRGTVIRERGKGLRIKPKPKTKSGWRTLELPSWAVAMLKARMPEDAKPDDPVFPAPLGGLRDPSNSNHDLRVVFDHAGYKWVTSHVYRKTVATLMDESGLPVRVIADQLGHAKVSMTQDVYLGRKTRKTGAASVLEAIESSDQFRG